MEEREGAAEGTGMGFWLLVDCVVGVGGDDVDIAGGRGWSGDAMLWFGVGDDCRNVGIGCGEMRRAGFWVDGDF